MIPSKLYANPETDEDFRAYSGEYLKNDVKKAQAEWTKAQADVGKKVKLSLLAADTDQGKRIAEYVQSQLQENLPGLEITISSQPSNNVNQSRREKIMSCLFQDGLPAVVN